MLISKASGETENFSRHKLRESLLRTGATEEVVDLVLSTMESQIRHGIKSSALHSLAFGLLKKYSRPSAARYSIKRALMDLGPTGYPFERLIGELLKKRGYEVRTGITVQGACVQHEIDVLAHTAEHQIFAECKFHNKQGIRTEVKTALYVYARFLDTSEAFRAREESNVKRRYEQWLVSNTRFTGDAAQFGRCRGMTLLGWDYPTDNGLQHLITRERLYPLTCLTTLSLAQKRGLLNHEMILCSDVPENMDLLKHSLTKGQELRLREEIERLLG